MNREFEGKKLLILGGNPETSSLVEIANNMGIQTIVSSARHTDPAKQVAWKAYDVDGMDVPGLVALAREEKVNGVLVGVADILVLRHRISSMFFLLKTFSKQPVNDMEFMVSLNFILMRI